MPKGSTQIPFVRLTEKHSSRRLMVNSTSLNKHIPYKIPELFNQYCGTVQIRNASMTLLLNNFILINLLLTKIKLNRREHKY